MEGEGVISQIHAVVHGMLQTTTTKKYLILQGQSQSSEKPAGRRAGITLSLMVV